MSTCSTHGARACARRTDLHPELHTDPHPELRPTAREPGLAVPPRWPRCPRGRGDDGQAGLLVGLLVAALVAVAALLTARLGDAVAERTRARTAADAAALAGVTGGRAAAESVASANGGRLASYRLDGAVVEATVVVGQTQATSRAAPSFRSAARAGPRFRADGGAAVGSTPTCSEPCGAGDPCDREGFP